MLKAITRSTQLVDCKIAAINRDRVAKGQGSVSVASYFDHYATDGDTDVSVTEADFEAARKELVPSVSLDELRHYERVRDTFEGATGKGSRPATSVVSETDYSSQLPPEHLPPPRLASPTRRTNGNHTGSRDKIPTLNGFARLQSAPGTQKIPAATRLHADSSDDEFVVRTDQLNLKDHSNAQDSNALRPPLPSSKSSKGKGKGKAKRAQVAIGDGDGEDLYD